MIEGRGSDDFATARRMAYGRPDLLSRLIDINARAVAAYLNAQIDAGADAVMIFDTWGGLLSSSAYRAFSLESMRNVLAALRGGVPTIVFTKGAAGALEDLARCGASAVGLDWTIDIGEARSRVGDRVALQGNLDPLVLLTDATTVAREAAAIVRAAGPQPGHVFNLGHGIVPTTPPEHVAALVDAVHRESRALRRG
jgi:uroporphyrinogen decarboxylase